MSYVISHQFISGFYNTIMCFFTSYRIIFHPCIHNQTTSCQIASHHVNSICQTCILLNLNYLKYQNSIYIFWHNKIPWLFPTSRGAFRQLHITNPPTKNRSVTVLPRFFTKAVVPSPVEEHSALALAAKSSVVAWGNLGVDQPENLEGTWKTHREDDFPPWNWKNRYRKKRRHVFL